MYEWAINNVSHCLLWKNVWYRQSQLPSMPNLPALTTTCVSHIDSAFPALVQDRLVSVHAARAGPRLYSVVGNNVVHRPLCLNLCMCFTNQSRALQPHPPLRLTPHKVSHSSSTLQICYMPNFIIANLLNYVTLNKVGMPKLPKEVIVTGSISEQHLKPKSYFLSSFS